MGVGKFVDRDRIPIAAAFRQRNWFWLGNAKRLRHMLGRQHRPSATRPHRVSVAPDFEIPIGYRTVGVEGCLQFRHHRRPEGLVFLREISPSAALGSKRTCWMISAPQRMPNSTFTVSA